VHGVGNAVKEKQYLHHSPGRWPMRYREKNEHMMPQHRMQGMQHHWITHMMATPRVIRLGAVL